MLTATVKGLPELLSELQRLSEAAQGRVVARHATPDIRPCFDRYKL
jgi:hypothetical protein